MDQNLSEDLAVFRDEVRRFCRNVLPEDIKTKVRTERSSLNADDSKDVC